MQLPPLPTHQLVLLPNWRYKLTLISIGLSFFTAVADLTSGCLEGDVARDGIERPDPFPEGFMVRCAVGVENEDESLGPAPCVEPN